MAEANIAKIEADAIFHAIMTCLPAVTQAYRYFPAQGKTEVDFDRCAHEAMTRAVRNAVQLTAREVKDPGWPYALEYASGTAPALPAEVIALLRIWQSHLGESRDQCDEPGRKLWDRIEVACGGKGPQ